MFKKLLTVLSVIVFTGCDPVYADELDTFNSMDVHQQCGWKAKTYVGAMESRVSGHAREIKHLDLEMIQSWKEEGKIEIAPDGTLLNLPKDAMWYSNYNNVSERSKEFIKDIVFTGWDMADYLLSKEEWSDSRKGIEGQKYWEACLYEYGSRRNI